MNEQTIKKKFELFSDEELQVFLQTARGPVTRRHDYIADRLANQAHRELFRRKEDE